MSEIDKKSFVEIAHHFFHQESQPTQQPSTVDQIWVYTQQHLFLVSISLLLAILIGLPLGILSARFAVLGHFILLFAGIVQTIPSLALLCFMIPLFGIGTTPALIALFLYGLLPIVINTHTGLTAINPRLIDSARALGLSEMRRLWSIELPLALPSILAGVKTSAITNIGTATLAALVGAGGYGTPIVTGLAVNNLHAILQGAIPAAAMALIVSWLFDLSIYLFIPRLRRLRPTT